MSAISTDRTRKASTPKYRAYDKRNMELCTRVAGEILAGEHDQPGGTQVGVSAESLPALHRGEGGVCMTDGQLIALMAVIVDASATDEEWTLDDTIERVAIIIKKLTEFFPETTVINGRNPVRRSSVEMS